MAYFGGVSIVIPVWNNLQLTKRCIASVCAFSDVKYRLVVVDDGSTDNTQEYLQNLAFFQPDLVNIRNEENLGFTRAVNRGIEAALESEYICILNNDVQVMPRWLSGLMAAAERAPKVGMAVPTQQHPVGRACSFFNDGRRAFEEVTYATMSCSLHPAEVFEELGLLDESLDRHLGSDLDFVLRMLDAGWKIMVARMIYIHHEKCSTLRLDPEWNDSGYQDRHYNKQEPLRRKWGDEKVDWLIDNMWKPVQE